MASDGIDFIKMRVAVLPTTPGVYRMLNAKGDVLYVGKAKNIKNRVTQYTQPDRMVGRIRRMVFQTRDLVVVETRTEAEALLLEANLIKSLKPKYNILFRDDASYPAILITDEPTPMMRYHRGAKREKGEYFGPYPAADAVYKTLDTLERAFRLRTCDKSTFSNRSRPCLKFDIGRCSAPCVGKISAVDYRENVKQASLFLQGKGTEVHRWLQEKMQAAAAAEQFEQAAEYRDRLGAIAKTTSHASAMTHGVEDADVFAAASQNGHVCVQGFFYRNGQHVGNQTYFPTGVEETEPAEIMRLFLAMHYASRAVPRVVLVHPLPAEADMLVEAFSVSAGHRVDIQSPTRGDKKTVVEQTLRNAQQALARKLSERENWQEQLTAFAQLLGVERPVARVECFDISNISGTNAVASMVVAGEGGMEKKHYRKFTIKNKNTPDDYSMMREVLTRRYGKLYAAQAEGEAADTPAADVFYPDVVLVDGGVGHLHVLQQVMAESAAAQHPHAPVLCAIAKGEERDKGLEKIFMADPSGNVRQLHVQHNSPLIFVLQRIRDEAHRFAIGFHRQKRAAGVAHSGLDDIPSIGAKRKKALLLHFGAAAGVKAASVDDLQRVPGISREIAEKIYGFYHG